MASFPTSKPSLKTDYDSEDVIASANQNTPNAELNAVIDKVGINSSADTTSLDYLVKNSSSRDPGHYHLEYGSALLVAASDAPAEIKKRAYAICDGTADNVEIQAALTAGSGNVRLSQGTFNIAASVELDTNYTLQGSGINSTILKLTNSANVSVLRSPAAASGNVFFVTVKDLCIDGNKANNSSGKGIFMKFAHTWLVEHVFIKNNAEMCVDVTATATGNIALNNWFKNCRMADSEQHNLNFGGFSPNNHVLNCIFGSTTGFSAVKLDNDEITFMGCHISGSASHGIEVTGSNNIIVGNYVEASAANGIDVANGSTGTRIEGNVIFNSGYGGGGGTFSGVKNAGQETAIVGNRMFDRQASKTQDYGIYIDSTATGTILSGNNVKASEHTTGAIFIDSSSNNNELYDIDGWKRDTNTWTRTGNHTFTMAGDFASIYQKGTKVRYKDGGSFEYGIVKSSAHAAGTTTVDLIPNTDYAMAAATITHTYYSYQDNPQAFPDWFTYTVTPTGFSADPTLSGKYTVKGKICTAKIDVVLPGTSNAVTMTYSLPIAAANTNNVFWIGFGVDNGTETSVTARIAAAATTITFAKGVAGTPGGFTNSGDKYGYFNGSYEI